MTGLATRWASVAGIGGGKGIFEDECLSVSLKFEKGIEEFDEADDDDEGTLTFVLILIAAVGGSSSIELDAIARSRSFRTSRTVR